MYALREYGIPQLNLRPWSPANYAGEPLLVHYFPLPFIAMALASYFMPPGLAFNLLTFLPLLLTPLAVAWSCGRLARGFGATMNHSGCCGSLSGILSLGVLFNDGNSMWGGNIFSVLAGQFAHQYALVFFFLLMGVLPSALQKGRGILGASLLFAATILSHAYVALFLGVVFIGAAFFLVGSSRAFRLQRVLIIGTTGSLFSLWFWWPLIDNSKWTTPYGFAWQFQDWFGETFPRALAPSLMLFVLGTVVSCFISSYGKRIWRGLAFWLLQVAMGILGYAFFNRLGLVDIRAWPQLQYALAASAAWFISSGLVSRSSWGRAVAVVLAVLVPFLQISLLQSELVKAAEWVEWNYSGWTNKEGFPSVRAIGRQVSGTFNDPRIAFEHDGIGNQAGTERVFEMLPYFSGRSTTDGVYMQSTLLAPMAFYQQALLSKDPSCPFSEYPCANLDISRGVELGRLLGVNTFILSSPDSIGEADHFKGLSLELDAKPWRVYHLVGNSSYAEVIENEPSVISTSDWRKKFWDWFVSYSPKSRVLVAGAASLPAQAFEPSSEHCVPRVDVNFGTLVLKTNCPGKFHSLKFAFHDSWRASHGEQLWPVSPGFIGIIPQSAETTLTFGQSPSWTFASLVSLIALLVILSVWVLRRYSAHSLLSRTT
ncbi:MAG: hypothetical protein HYR96_10040 [Deltaproteobacteria bacterium]|nr:hypothetical protein [Deltaproteobacteria bacterium]